MARIPDTYARRRTPDFRRPLPSMATGGAMGRAVQNLGGAVGVAAEASESIVEDRANMEALKRDNAFAEKVQSLLYDPEKGYLAQRKGNAVAARDDALKKLDALKNETLKDAGWRVGRKLTDTIEKRLLAARTTVDRHAVVEERGFISDGLNARLETSANGALAGMNSPEMRTLHIDEANRTFAALAAHEGWTGEEMKNKRQVYMSTVWSNMTSRVLRESGAVEALAFAEANADKFTPVMLEKIRTQLDGEVKEHKGRSYAKELLAGGAAKGEAAKGGESKTVDLNRVQSRLSALGVVNQADDDFVYGRSATANAKPFEGIVFHHTAEGTNAKQMADYGKTVDASRNGAFGYHFYIDRDGTIIQGAPLNKRTNHVKSPGKSQRKSHTHLSNSNSVGITLAGAEKNATAAQKASAKKLALMLAEEYGIGASNITGHGIVQSDRQAHEGKEIADLVRDALGGGEAMTEPEIMAAIAAMPDPDERRAALAEARIGFAQRDARQKAAKEGFTQAAFDYVVQGGDPREMPNEIKSALGRTEMSGLITYYEKTQKGEKVTTDWTVYNALQLEAHEDPAAFGERSILEFRAKLGDTEFKELHGLWLKARAGEMDAPDRYDGWRKVYTDLGYGDKIDKTPEGEGNRKVAQEIFTKHRAEVDAWVEANPGKRLGQSELYEIGQRVIASVDMTETGDAGTTDYEALIRMSAEDPERFIGEDLDKYDLSETERKEMARKAATVISDLRKAPPSVNLDTIPSDYKKAGVDLPKKGDERAKYLVWQERAIEQFIGATGRKPNDQERRDMAKANAREVEVDNVGIWATAFAYARTETIGDLVPQVETALAEGGEFPINDDVTITQGKLDAVRKGYLGGDAYMPLAQNIELLLELTGAIEDE